MSQIKHVMQLQVYEACWISRNKDIIKTHKVGVEQNFLQVLWIHSCSCVSRQVQSLFHSELSI
jgi:hypothetical protein